MCIRDRPAAGGAAVGARAAAPALALCARARQFSSFVVLVGTVASATEFAPTHAAIVSNKDELRVPLELATIPTPRAFADAI